MVWSSGNHTYEALVWSKPRRASSEVLKPVRVIIGREDVDSEKSLTHVAAVAMLRKRALKGCGEKTRKNAALSTSDCDFMGC